MGGNVSQQVTTGGTGKQTTTSADWAKAATDMTKSAANAAGQIFGGGGGNTEGATKPELTDNDTFRLDGKPPSRPRRNVIDE